MQKAFIALSLGLQLRVFFGSLKNSGVFADGNGHNSDTGVFESIPPISLHDCFRHAIEAIDAVGNQLSVFRTEAHVYELLTTLNFK